MSNKPGPLAGRALTRSFPGSRFWPDYHRLDYKACEGNESGSEREGSLGPAQRPVQPGGGRASRKEDPALGWMSTAEETQPQSSIQHNTQHDASWTCKDVHTSHPLFREAEKCILHFRKIKKKFFPPSTNRFLEELTYFGPRAALCAKLKP